MNRGALKLGSAGLRLWLARALVGASDFYTAVSPLQRGKARLRARVAEWLQQLGAFYPRKLTIRDGGLELPLWFNLGGWTGARIWCDGRCPVVGIAECVAVMAGSKGGVFLDVGANAGLIGFSVAARVPGTRVILVEPHRGLAALLKQGAGELRERLAVHGSRVEVVGVALGEADGTVLLHELRHDDLSSLFPVPGEAGDVRPVTMRSGDALLAELDVGEIELCKIDVEGAERRVLEGLAATLRTGRIRRLRIEMNRERCAAAGYTVEDLVAALAGFGYVMTPESAEKYAAGNWAWSDFHFTRQGAVW